MFIIKLFLFVSLLSWIYYLFIRPIIKEKKINNLIRDYERNKYKTHNTYENTKEIYRKTYRNRQKTSYNEKMNKGKNYESFIGNYYRSLNYRVIENGKIMGRKDGGIDIIAENDTETLLIQCKNYKENTTWKIRHKDIKAFRSDCIDYIEDNPNIKQKRIKKLFIASNDIYHISAQKYIEEKKKKGEEIECKVIPY